MEKQKKNKSNFQNPLDVMFGVGSWPKDTPEWVRNIPGFVAFLFLVVVSLAALFR